jgi:hypothetical protein
MRTALERNGQSSEEDCPYQPTAPSSTWRPLCGVSVYRRRSRSVPATTIEIESALKSGRVAVLGLELSASFFQPQSPWIISATATTHGLHAVLGVGLGSFQSARIVLIRNSWGDSWADNGHAWLDQSYMNRHLRAVVVLAEEVLP